MGQKILTKTALNGGGIVSGSPDAGVAGLLDTAGDILVCDVREMTNVTVSAIQVLDAGTATLLIEVSNDAGASWALATSGTLSEASFAAFNGAAVLLGLSDARGMSLAIQMVRARLTAVSGGGTYRMAISGIVGNAQ
jgi:hypothetical protein